MHVNQWWCYRKGQRITKINRIHWGTGLFEPNLMEIPPIFVEIFQLGTKW